MLTAVDGAEALAGFKREASSLRAVVLDVTMPGLDGEEVLPELRRLSATLPVIMASGYGGDQMAARFQELGASGFVEKPYRSATLLAALRKVLQP